jgi:hypothetical protein
MRRISAVILFTGMMLAVAGAQESGGVEASLTSGYVFPSSPMAFANYWTIQYGGGLQVGIPLSESVSMVGSFEYYRFKMSETGVSEGFDVEYVRDIWIFDRVSLSPSADASSVIALSANLRVAPSPRAGSLSPYFTAGFGVMQLSIGEISLPVTSVLTVGGNNISMTAQNRIVGGKETALLLQSGIGIDLNVSESLSAFLEARYALGLTKGHSTSYIPLNIGLKYHL